MYTGKLVRVYKDVNPYSSTYGSTYNEIIEESEYCDTSCSMELAETWSVDDVVYERYVDSNNFSPTNGQTITIEQDSLDSIKLLQFSKCELILYNNTIYGNSGNIINTYIEANPNRSDYKDVSEETEEDDSCVLPNTLPKSDSVEVCLLESFPSGFYAPSGLADIYYYDINPFSPTYKLAIGDETNIPSPNCIPPTTDPKNLHYCDYCETDEYGNQTGTRIDYDRDINLYSSTYDPDIVETRVEGGCSRIITQPYIKGKVIDSFSGNNIYVKINGVNEQFNVEGGSFTIPLDDSDSTYRFDNVDKNNFSEISFITENTIARNASYMFNSCENLKKIDLSGFSISGTSIEEMFGICRSLESIQGFAPDTSRVTYFGFLFRECESLLSLDLSGLNTSSATNMAGMFLRCNLLTYLDLSSFTTANVTTFSEMFARCLALKELNLDGWIINQGANVSNMFLRCDSLEKIYLRNSDQTTYSILNTVKPAYTTIITA